MSAVIFHPWADAAVTSAWPQGAAVSDALRPPDWDLHAGKGLQLEWY